jgi:hypothetical protein
VGYVLPSFSWNANLLGIEFRVPGLFACLLNRELRFLGLHRSGLVRFCFPSSAEPGLNVEESRALQPRVLIWFGELGRN